MIEDSTRTRSSRSAISQDKILDWLVEERVLSIALEGSSVCLCHVVLWNCFVILGSFYELSVSS